MTAHILHLLRTEAIFDKVVSRQQASHAKELQTEVERLQKVLDAYPERKTRLFDLYEKGDITREEFLKRKDQHNQGERTCRQLLVEKQAVLAKATSEKIGRESFDRMLKDLERSWEQADPAVQKHKLAALIERIVLENRTFRISFRLDPPTTVKPQNPDHAQTF